MDLGNFPLKMEEFLPTDTLCSFEYVTTFGNLITITHFKAKRPLSFECNKMAIVLHKSYVLI